MTINVSEALDSDTAQLATVVRYEPSQQVNGIWQRPQTRSFKALMSLQQPSPKQLEILPENERTLDIRLFISNKRVRTSDEEEQVNADEIHLNGQKFKVIRSGDWNAFGHTTGLCVRKK